MYKLDVTYSARPPNPPRALKFGYQHPTCGSNIYHFALARKSINTSSSYTKHGASYASASFLDWNFFSFPPPFHLSVPVATSDQADLKRKRRKSQK